MTITNFYTPVHISGFITLGLDMLQGITNRLPVVLVNAIQQAGYRGSTYAFLTLLAGFVASVLDLGSHSSPLTR